MLARGTKITQLPAQKCSTLWWYSRIPTSLTLEPWWFSGQNVRSSIWFLLLPSENVHWKCRCAAHQCIIKIKEHHFPPLAAVFVLETSWITFKIVAFQVEASCLCCVHSRKRKLARPGSIFPAFCHATFHRALITCCNVARAGYIA